MNIVEGKIINHDQISRRVTVNKILEIDDIEITPKALNRILCVIQNMPPYEMTGLEDANNG